MTKCAFIPNFLKFYNILWQAALPFLRLNRRLGPSFDRRVHPSLPRADIWIQAASAGEAFLALSILSRLAPADPVKVLVTTTTDQGLEVLETGLKELDLPAGVTAALDLFPFDMPGALKTAVTQVAPRVMVLLETELWPATLYELRKRQTSVLVVNARMSIRSGARYRKTRWLWQCLAPDQILAISPEDGNRYRAVFPKTPVQLMPNIKFDIMETAPHGPQDTDPELSALFTGPLPLSVLASFRRQEEKDIMVLISRLKKDVPDQIIALFPRHMHRLKALEKKLQHQGIPFILRSQLNRPVTRPCVMLWDRFGELRQAYTLASAVFVGGSLKPLGGQNFLEPAALGIPTVIGPYWDDFAWAGEGIFALEFVSRVSDTGAVAEKMAATLRGPRDIRKNREAAYAYMASMQGGSSVACRAILQFIES